jgi:hypothetical protein
MNLNFGLEILVSLVIALASLGVLYFLVWWYLIKQKNIKKP